MNKIALFSFSLLTLLLTGCLNDDKYEAPAPIPTSYLSVFHASPTTQEYDFRLDSVKVFNRALRYLDYSNYRPIKPGNFNVQFSSVGAINPLVDTTINFVENKAYSLFLVEAQPHISLIATHDTIIKPAAGKAVLRITQFSPDAPAINLSLTSAEGKVEHDSLSYKTVTEFVQVPSGTHTIEIKNKETGEKLLNNFNIQLAAGKTHTLILRGYVTPPSGNPNTLSAQLITNF